MSTEFDYLKMCLNISCSILVPQSGLQLTRDTETTYWAIISGCLMPCMVNGIMDPKHIHTAKPGARAYVLLEAKAALLM